MQDQVGTAACRRCVNDLRNPTVTIQRSGLCQICDAYGDGPSRAARDRELEFVKSFAKGHGGHDAMFGLSGGKDSTAALVRAVELGFKPFAFTFDTGYYPAHIVPRAAEAAATLGVDHTVIDVRSYIRSEDRLSYEMTAEVFDRPESEDLVRQFRRLYVVNRQFYSVRHSAPMSYVRTCQLCRRLVVRAYHREATKRGVRVILLGTNEWVGLSQPLGGRYRFSGVRALNPDPSADPVYVVHLPFLLGVGLDDTQKVLERVGWAAPVDEQFVESCANSCLLSRAAEAKATRMLGFHPDTTRLARECTVGFLSRDEAARALAQQHDYPLTVREVLTEAGILR